MLCCYALAIGIFTVFEAVTTARLRCDSELEEACHGIPGLGASETWSETETLKHWNIVYQTQKLKYILNIFKTYHDDSGDTTHIKQA
jgi:hypothetical protein